jgi:hypothetical protein
VTLYDPEIRPGCGGYVLGANRSSAELASEPTCIFNSYESTHLILIVGVMAVMGFYFHMPPYAAQPSAASSWPIPATAVNPHCHRHRELLSSTATSAATPFQRSS